MPQVRTNGVRLAYERTGAGEPVLMIMGSAAGGRVWTLHQTPALHEAGYETITFDHRGIAPSDAPPGRYSLADMTADTAGLIRELGLAPARVVGTSLGALVAQELMINEPDLVSCAVLMGTKARSDATRAALGAAHRALAESGVALPGCYQAAMSVIQMFSRASLNDDAVIRPLLDIFELSGDAPGARGQAWADVGGDRREALSGVVVPARVIAFAEDLITPPHLCAEVADAIPDCDLVEIPGCGHLGFLERPDEVNSAVIEFLDKN